MVVYEIYWYIIISHTWDILIHCISIVGKRVKECAISWRVEI
jgi:hypothetical protein